VNESDVEDFQAKIAELIRDPQLPIFHDFRLQTSKTTWIWVESAISNMLFFKTVKALVINFRDITERKQAEFSLREAFERTEDYANRLRQLNDATITIHSAIHAQEIIQQVCDYARQLMNAHQATIALQTPNEATDYIYTASFSDSYSQDVVAKNPNRLIGYFGENLILCYTQDELESLPELVNLLTSLSGGEPPINGWMCAALTINGEIIGILDCTDKIEGQFSADDCKLMVQLSLIASSSIENHYLFQNQQLLQLDIKKNAQKVESAFNGIDIPFIIINAKGQIEFFNKSVMRLFPSLATASNINQHLPAAWIEAIETAKQEIPAHRTIEVEFAAQLQEVSYKAQIFNHQLGIGIMIEVQKG
jgi:PAS domain-containing protein